MTNGAMAAAAHRPMTVDAHHHFWDLTVRDQPWTAGMPTLRRSFSLDDFRPDLAANHVDRTVVVQTVGVEEETPELLSLAEISPEIAGVVGWVDLCAVNVADQLAALRQRGGDVPGRGTPSGPRRARPVLVVPPGGPQRAEGGRGRRTGL